MRAIQILEDEHKVILAVLAALEKIADEARLHGRFNPAVAGDIVEFLRTFADACHHSKEEETLFRLLRRQHVAEKLIDQLETEHQDGRACVSRMERAIREASVGRTNSIPDFADAAESMIEMLRAHITREDDGLFVLAASSLNDSEMHTLLASFEQIEGDAGNRRHHDGIKLADAICEAVGTPNVAKSSISTLIGAESKVS